MTKAGGLLALVWLSAPVPVRSGPGVANNPMACATDMSNLVEVITTASVDITFATNDCSPAGLDELDCSTDIVDAIKKLSDVASTISSATGTCGGVNNACATEVTASIKDMLDVGTNLIAASADCAQAPFICVVDISESINSAMSVAVDIFAAVADCNPQPVNEYHQPDLDDKASYDAAVKSLGLDPDDPGVPVERRLAGDGPVRAPGQKPPGQAEGWKHYVESAREKIASWRDHFTSLGIGTESSRDRRAVGID